MGNEGRGCLVSRQQGLNVAAGSATNDQACDYIAAPSISAQKPPPFPVHGESNSRHTSLFPVSGETLQPGVSPRSSPLSDRLASTRRIQMYSIVVGCVITGEKRADNERSIFFHYNKRRLKFEAPFWGNGETEFVLKFRSR